jgi:hypothetical protein
MSFMSEPRMLCIGGKIILIFWLGVILLMSKDKLAHGWALVKLVDLLP